MILPPTFSSVHEYAARLHSVDYWKPFLTSILERHELGVGDLCRVLQLPQSTVSRHLKILGDESWLRSQRRGTTNLYHMSLDDLEESQRRLWRLVREQVADWATFQQDQVRLIRQLREKQGDTRDFFAGVAGQWDQTRLEMYGDTYLTHAMLAMLPRDWTVADLGCGTGSLTLDVASHVNQVIAVEIGRASCRERV